MEFTSVNKQGKITSGNKKKKDSEQRGESDFQGYHSILFKMPSFQQKNCKTHDKNMKCDV